jgi:undecaprenyl pyrophosphate phosphatase UppP
MQTKVKQANATQVLHIIKMLTAISYNYLKHYAAMQHNAQQMQDVAFALSAINAFANNKNCKQLYNCLQMQDTLVVEHYSSVFAYLSTNNLI